MSSKRKTPDTAPVAASTKRSPAPVTEAPAAETPRIGMMTYAEVNSDTGIPMGSFIRMNKDTYVRPVTITGKMALIQTYSRYSGRDQTCVVGDITAAKQYAMVECPGYDFESPTILKELMSNTHKKTKAAYPYVIEPDAKVVARWGNTTYMCGNI